MIYENVGMVVKDGFYFPFCNDLEDNGGDVVCYDDNDWQTYENYVKPATDVVQQQCQHLIIGDFYTFLSTVKLKLILKTFINILIM